MPRRYRKPTKARPARPRLRGAACRRPQRLLGRDRLRSVGSCRSQADEARRHAGGRTSGNGPDTTERAPLDARGWVPSVFRARPANDKESGRAMPATPGKKDRLTRPCVFAMEPPAVRVHDGAPGCACARWMQPAPKRPCRHRGVKGQKVKVKAKESRRRVAAAFEAAPC